MLTALKRSQQTFAFYLLALIFFSACNSTDYANHQRGEKGHPDHHLFRILPSEKTGLRFNNVNIDTKDLNFAMSEYFYMGGGTTVADFNNDGLPDLFFCGNLVSNALYLNSDKLSFKDITQSSGLDNNHWTISATPWDFNGDGWMDLYVSNAGTRKKYKDSPNQLWINNKDLTFSNKIDAFNLQDSGLSTQLVPIDFDVDGDMDFFMLKHIDFQDQFKGIKSTKDKIATYEDYISKPGKLEQYGNILFENVNGKFIRSEKKAGLQDWGFGLAAVVSDLNKDGYPDIYVTNDYLIPDFLYINNQDGTFTNQINQQMQHTSHFSMGCDIADINNDTWPDIAVVDMTSPDRVRNKTLMAAMNPSNFYYLVNQKGFKKQFMFNTLQLNHHGQAYSEIANMISASLTDWSWSALLADYNLNGHKDYFISNGVKRDARHRDVEQEIKNKNQSGERLDILERVEMFPSVPVNNYFFENKGELLFNNVSDKWLNSKPSFSHGAVYSDLDLDGDLDLVTNNMNAEAFLYENKATNISDASFIKLKFNPHPDNHLLKAYCYSGDEVQYQELNSVKGYFSVSESLIHFGIKKNHKVDSIRLICLNGSSKLLINPELNQTHNIESFEKEKFVHPPKKEPLFSQLSMEGDIGKWKHQENPFNDFKNEVLLPHSQSRLGPFIAVGDINNDGLDDVFVSGPRMQESVLFKQSIDGGFNKTNIDAFKSSKGVEDLGAVFFDIDGDEDQDLYVVTGGNEFRPYGPALKDRIYINNGNGVFEYDESRLVQDQNHSGSKVIANDYDGDGDIDLFVCGRLIPGNYPIFAQSSLLENQNGTMVDITKEKAKDLVKLGLANDAIWVDLNQDKKQDLIIVGEWMNIEVFIQNDSNEFNKKTNDYFSYENRGWWNSIVAYDFDNDGDNDLIAGNLGLNNKFHASDKKPLDIYFNDFDDNGTNDIVLAKYDDGNPYLLRGKDCSSEQMPFISDKFKSYEDFANAKIFEVLPEKKLEKSIHYSVKDFSTSYFENTTNGFVKKSLPAYAQLAPVNAILLNDLNEDGNMDVILAGNNFDTEVETPSYDAGVGSVLIGNGKGAFKAVSQEESGLLLNKNLKDMEWVKTRKGIILLASNNNASLDSYKLNK